MPGQVTATTLRIPEPAIADLRERPARTRFPDQAPGPAWSFATDLEYLQEVVEYCRTRFEWRAQEARLNAFPQYQAGLFDIDLHFLHVPSRGPAPCQFLQAGGDVEELENRSRPAVQKRSSQASGALASRRSPIASQD
jgi:hypothetical protein